MQTTLICAVLTASILQLGAGQTYFTTLKIEETETKAKITKEDENTVRITYEKVVCYRLPNGEMYTFFVFQVEKKITLKQGKIYETTTEHCKNFQSKNGRKDL